MEHNYEDDARTYYANVLRMCEFAAIALDDVGYNAVRRAHEEALYRLNHGPLDHKAAARLARGTRETLDIYLRNQ